MEYQDLKNNDVVKKVVRIIFFLFVGLFVIIRFYSSVEENYTASPSVTLEEDYFTADTLQNDIRLTHTRIWRDFDDSQRSIRYSVSSSLANESSDFRNTVNVKYDGNEKIFWKDLYSAKPRFAARCKNHSM